MRWIVFGDIAISEKQRADSPRVLGDEELRDEATAVAADEVDLRDVERVEKLAEQLGLGFGCDALGFRSFGPATTHNVRRYATAKGSEAFESPAPLIAIEREAVQKERRGAAARFDVGYTAHREFCEFPVVRVPGEINGLTGFCGDGERGRDSG